MKGFYIEITNNLLDPKHRKHMKESVWLFMWLLDKITSISEEGVGTVLGGKPIKYEEVNEDLDISERTYKRWILDLKKYQYINTKRAPYGLIISVNKAKKRFGRSVKNGTSDGTKMAHLHDKNGTSNKTSTVDVNNEHVSDEPTAFNLEEEIEKLKTDQRRHIQIIGLWMEIKKLKPGNKEQFDSIKKRNMRPAILLKGYGDQDIKDTLEHTKTLKYLTNIGLETILKYIDEVIKSKNKREPEKKEIRINGRLVIGRREVRKFDDDNRPYLTTVPIFEDK